MYYILFIFIVAFCTGSVQAQQNNNWNIFRGNQALTGYTNMIIPSDPDILWSYKTEAEIKASPVIKNNKIIIGSTDGSVYCINTVGKLIWKVNTGNAIEASALILNNRVYVGNLSGTLFCLDLNNGSKIWEYKTDNQIMGSPNWWQKDGKTYILVGSYDYFLHCVNATNGHGIWKYESNNFLNGAVAIDNDKAIFGGCDGFLHVVDILSGKAHAQIEIATYVAGSACIEDNKAYIGDYDGQFSCVNLDNQKIEWQWKNKESMLPFIASPSLVENNIIIGNRDKFVYCFDKKTGELKWKTNTGNRIDASCIVSDNNILASNMRGDILMIERESGTIIWTYQLGSAIFSNPVVHNKKIITGSSDGWLYCLGIK